VNFARFPALLLPGKTPSETTAEIKNAVGPVGGERLTCACLWPLASVFQPEKFATGQQGEAGAT